MLPVKLPWETAQTRWKSQLDPVLSNPMNQVSVLKDVMLVTGPNVINHLLGHKMNGWFLVDQQGPSTIYRTAPLNALTLTLDSSAPVVVSIGVF